MLVGYARVSTNDQNLDLQIDALKKAGCERVFTDKISGTVKERPGLEEARSFLRKGDTIVVWKLDRLGRSLIDLINIINKLRDDGVEFRSLQESIDTSTSTGKLFFHIFGALAEFERDVIRERTNAGLQAARARGRVGGRRPLMDDNKIAMAAALLKDPNNPVNEICKMLNVSRTTLYRQVKKYNEINKGVNKQCL